MRNGYCHFWFEKLPEGWSRREGTLVDVCARGGIAGAVALVCVRQRPPQFPLRPYNRVQNRVSGYSSQLRDVRGQTKNQSVTGIPERPESPHPLDTVGVSSSSLLGPTM
jgi:hypothetical protein